MEVNSIYLRKLSGNEKLYIGALCDMLGHKTATGAVHHALFDYVKLKNELDEAKMKIKAMESSLVYEQEQKIQLKESIRKLARLKDETSKLESAIISQF